MINFQSSSVDARNRPSGENDIECTILECRLRILVFSFKSNGVQMTISPSSNLLNENENQKFEIAPLPPCPFQPREKGRETLSFLQSQEVKGLRGKVRKQKHLASTPSYCTFSIYPIFLVFLEKRIIKEFATGTNIKKWVQNSQFNPIFQRRWSVRSDKLTKPKWNCRPISWPRPLPRRPFVSRLDAKPNSNKCHRPLFYEWVCRCPLTKSIRKKGKMGVLCWTWTATTIYRHPSVGWTSGQTFRSFVPCHMWYPILNEITENRLSRMCNDMSMGKQNSRVHVGIVYRVFLWKLSIRQFSKFQFLCLFCLSK